MVTDALTDAVSLQLAKELKAAGLVYVHLVDHTAMGGPKPSPELTKGIREAFGGTLILAGGFDGAKAEQALEEKRGELVAFGRPFIGNPTLVKKPEIARCRSATAWPRRTRTAKDSGPCRRLRRSKSRDVSRARSTFALSRNPRTVIQTTSLNALEPPCLPTFQKIADSLALRAWWPA